MYRVRVTLTLQQSGTTLLAFHKLRSLGCFVRSDTRRQRADASGTPFSFQTPNLHTQTRQQSTTHHRKYGDYIRSCDDSQLVAIPYDTRSSAPPQSSNHCEAEHGHDSGPVNAARTLPLYLQSLSIAEQ
jgi:hypothetical protein